MIRWGAAMIAGAILLTGCSSEPSTHPSSAANVDTPGLTFYAPADRATAPTLSGSTLAGTHMSLADFTGTGVVVVNVWASWCTECRAESRGLGALATTFGSQHGVRFLGIDEQDVASKAKAFTAAEHVDYPQLVDAQGTLLHQLPMLPSDGIPSTVVIDRQGRVAGRIIGATTESQLHHLILRIAAEH